MSYQLNQKKFLTDEELRLFLFKLETSPKFFERLILDIAISTGARASEILRLSKDDLNPHDKTLFFTGLKGSNDRAIPIKDELWDRLMSHVSKLKGDQIFPINLRLFYRIWTRYRPVRKSLHSLRHTFAIQTYKRHRDLRLVQVALGHKSIQSTMVYAQYVYQTDELRKLLC